MLIYFEDSQGAARVRYSGRGPAETAPRIRLLGAWRWVDQTGWPRLVSEIMCPMARSMQPEPREMGMQPRRGPIFYVIFDALGSLLTTLEGVEEDASSIGRRGMLMYNISTCAVYSVNFITLPSLTLLCEINCM